MEECWSINNHRELGKEPLECLECKRMKGKTIMDMPENEDLCMLLQGYRLAMFEIAGYLSESITPQQKILIQGIELRMKCAIDRGISVEQLQKGIAVFTERYLNNP